MTTWLVTGGAGYIGAHVLRALTANGYGAVAFDDLSSGRPNFVPAEVPLVNETILNTERLTQTLREYDCAG